MSASATPAAPTANADERHLIRVRARNGSKFKLVGDGRMTTLLIHAVRFRGGLDRTRQIALDLLADNAQLEAAQVVDADNTRRVLARLTREDLNAQTRADKYAAEHLGRCGFEIVARQARTRYGVIDLIAADSRTIAFVAVRARQGTDKPWSSTDERKRLQIRRMATAWLAETSDRPRRPEVRFDAIAVTVDDAGQVVALEHLEAAY
jgi:putative endonuclease